MIKGLERGVKQPESRWAIDINRGSKELNDPHQGNDYADYPAKEFQIRNKRILFDNVKMGIEIIMVWFEFVNAATVSTHKVFDLSLLSSSREKVHVFGLDLKLLLLVYESLTLLNQLIASVL